MHRRGMHNQDACISDLAVEYAQQGQRYTQEHAGSAAVAMAAGQRKKKHRLGHMHGTAPHSPAMTPSMIAASWTVLDKGPMQSRDEPYAIRPYREIRPYVGFSPTTPQKLAGCLILPPAAHKHT